MIDDLPELELKH